MSDQAGSSVAAIEQRQEALANRHRAVADADRVLAEAVASAHGALRDSVHRLDAIAAEIERRGATAVDTPTGVRELQKYLLAKQREIATVVTEARDLSLEQSAVLQSLREQYSS